MATQPSNLSQIEVFIIARIVALVKIGWTRQAIADALSVTLEFVDRALLLATTLR